MTDVDGEKAALGEFLAFQRSAATAVLEGPHEAAAPACARDDPPPAITSRPLTPSAGATAGCGPPGGAT